MCDRAMVVVDVDALIAEVRKRPPLYDTSIKEYHDRRLKKQLWDQVCRNLRSPEIWDTMNSKHKMKYEKEVQIKWNSLRTCFRRELRANQLQYDGFPEKKKRKYIYFDDLTFLLPFIKIVNNEMSMVNDPASDLSTVSEEDISQPKHSMTSMEIITNDNYQEPMMPITTIIKTETIVEIERNSDRSEFSDREEESLINRTESDFRDPSTKNNEHRPIIRDNDRILGNKRVSKTNEVDDDEAFLSSLLPSLKEFSSDEKLRLRIALLTTILNFKKGIRSE